MFTMRKVKVEALKDLCCVKLGQLWSDYQGQIFNIKKHDMGSLRLHVDFPTELSFLPYDLKFIILYTYQKCEKEKKVNLWKEAFIQKICHH
jgi:hypothetical protein